MKYVLMSFVFLISHKLIAQVDEYKMRQDIFSYQFKKQSIGEITQRVGSLNLELNTNAYEARLVDLLEHHSELYKSSNSFSISTFNYRGKPISSHGLWIDHIALNTTLYADNSFLLNQWDINYIDKVEILYGNNLALNTMDNSANIALYSKNSSMLIDTNFTRIIPKIQLGNLSNYGAIEISHQNKKNWANSLSLSHRQNDRYYTPSNNYTYPKITQTQIQNLFQKRFNPFDKLKFYFHLGLNSTMPELNNNQQDSSYKLYSHLGKYNPFIFSYLQWIKVNEESKWYTQLITSVSFLKTQLEDSIHFQKNNLIVSPSYTSNKLSIQSNGYKNLGSNIVYSYGINIGAEMITNTNFSSTYSNYTFKAPLINSQFYFKKEIRKSADISWIYAINLGLDIMDVAIEGNSQPLFRNHQKLNPNASLQATWTRHICENSNYSLNLFLSYKSPTLNQVKPLTSPIYFLPNNLSAEKSIGFDGNLYRKFDDKLEWNLSTYYIVSKDGIMTRDYYAERTIQVLFNGNLYDALQNENVQLSSNFGINNEFKYHFSKALTAYTTFHFQKRWIHSNQYKYEFIQTPIYGNFGVKFIYKKLFTQLWANYNLGYSIDNVSDKTRYELAYSDVSHNFSSYYTLHFSSSVYLLEKLKVSVKLDNLLNRLAFNYSSQIPNIGRSASVQIQCIF